MRRLWQPPRPLQNQTKVHLFHRTTHETKYQTNPSRHNLHTNSPLFTSVCCALHILLWKTGVGRRRNIGFRSRWGHGEQSQTDLVGNRWVAIKGYLCIAEVIVVSEQGVIRLGWLKKLWVLHMLRRVSQWQGYLDADSLWAFVSCKMYDRATVDPPWNPTHQPTQQNGSLRLPIL